MSSGSDNENVEDNKAQCSTFKAAQRRAVAYYNPRFAYVCDGGQNWIIELKAFNEQTKQFRQQAMTEQNFVAREKVSLTLVTQF